MDSVPDTRSFDQGSFDDREESKERNYRQCKEYFGKSSHDSAKSGQSSTSSQQKDARIDGTPKFNKQGADKGSFSDA